MIEDKSIKDLVADYIDGLDRKGYHSAWAKAAGDLADKTELSRVERGIIYVRTKGSPAMNLLMLRKRKILKAFNDEVPDAGARDIRTDGFY